jgi:O-antigen/teichoic acid export membrane protein
MSSEPLVENSLPDSDPPLAPSVEALPPEVSASGAFTGLFSAQGILDRARALKAVMRLKPFDTSTPEGRSLERYRRAGLTTATSVLAKGVTVLTSLITVRLTIHYLGTERYGLWMTITSIVAFLMFADLGIGNGLLHAIADARGREDDESVHRYVSSAFFILCGVAVLLLGVFALVYPFIPWPRVFNVSSGLAARESGPAVCVFLICFLLNLPLDVVQRVQTGHQEGFVMNLWTAMGSLTGLGGLLVAVDLHGGLPWLILAILGGQLAGVFGNWAYEFGWMRPALFPAWGYWDLGAARSIMGTGAMFFILQACGVFTIPLDNIVLTQVLGPAAVTQFAVPMRLFILLSTVASMFVVPLWPAYGEALGRGDLKWVRATFYHSLGYSILTFGPVALGLAAFGKLVVRVWVGTQVQPTYALLAGMAIWTILTVVGNAVFMFLCGVNKLKVQVIVSISQAIANLVLKIVLAKAFGISGVIWAAVLVTFFAAAAIFVYAHHILKYTSASPAGSAHER